jgi:hypothetical protein
VQILQITSTSTLYKLTHGSKYASGQAMNAFDVVFMCPVVPRLRSQSEQLLVCHSITYSDLIMGSGYEIRRKAEEKSRQAWE